MTQYRAGIANDPFFQELNLLFRNELARGKSVFEPFGDLTKVPYPLDSWFNDEFLVFEIPILDAKREDIQVTKTSDKLRIKYNRSNREDESKRTYVKRNIIKRDFDFTWQITSKFDHTGIQSVFENGILTIYIPFAKEAKPEEVPILDTASNWKKIAMGERLAAASSKFGTVELDSEIQDKIVENFKEQFK
jgi:HSP20 family molecular chaperone IbpA